jgi:hypothetical protein
MILENSGDLPDWTSLPSRVAGRSIPELNPIGRAWRGDGDEASAIYADRGDERARTGYRVDRRRLGARQHHEPPPFVIDALLAAGVWPMTTISHLCISPTRYALVLLPEPRGIPDRNAAYGRTGRWNEAMRCADEGIELCETHLERVYATELWRVKGELLYGKARAAMRIKDASARIADAADACLHRALESHATRRRDHSSSEAP